MGAVDTSFSAALREMFVMFNPESKIPNPKSQIHNHNVAVLRDCAMNSDVRIASARIVQVQFLSGLETNGPPSATKRFFTSCAWQLALTTDVFGSFPMRVVPTS